MSTFGQSLMNRGSKYWQERWEYVTKNRESELGVDVTKTRKIHDGQNHYFDKYYIEACIRAKGENWFIRSKRFSVSKITILVWDVITIFCFTIWVNEWISILSPEILKNHKFYPILLFHLIVLVYLLCTYFIKGRLAQKLSKSKNDMMEPENYNSYYPDSEHFVNNTRIELIKKP
jgi:hypothetical protein